MVQRTVRFYEVLDESGQQMPDIEWDDFLDAVQQIPESDAYVQIARMELLGSIYKPPTSSPSPRCSMLILDRITRDVRMRIENQRKYRPLQLEKDDTLADPTHFGLFPRNVIGMIRVGNNTPGASSLRDFINTAQLFEDPVTVKSLVDLDAARALADVDRLTKLSLEMDTLTAGEVLGERRLSRIFSGFRESFGGLDVEITLKVGRGNYEAGEAVLGEFSEVLAEGNRDAFKSAKMFYRRLEDGRADSYDFLGEAIATSAEVEIDESDGDIIDSSASTGIMDAYTRLYDDVQSALAGHEAS